MGEGPERGLHTASLLSISVASVRAGISVRPHDYSGGSGPHHTGRHHSTLVSRTLDVITAHTIEGAGVWYVDDLNACSNRRTYVEDMGRVDDEVRTLLGPESMAAEKDKSSRRLDMIGWLIDLDAQLVTISDRNFNKALHAFFSFDIVEPVTLHQV